MSRLSLPLLLLLHLSTRLARAESPEVPLPSRVGACEADDPSVAMSRALGGPDVLQDATVTAGQVSARLQAHASPVCRASTTDNRTIELAGIQTVPAPGEGAAPHPGWDAEHPLLLEVGDGTVRLSRWPLPSVAVKDTEREVLRGLLRVDRQLHPTRRIAVLHADPALPAPALDGWIGELAGAGYVSASLVTAPDAWTPPRSDAPVVEPRRGLVRTPVDVVVTADGSFAARFSGSTGQEPVHMGPTDIVAFQLACAGGACELLLLTETERYLVHRGPEPSAGELTRRWVFGHAVLPYEGPSLRPLLAPTVSGAELMPLAKDAWADLSADAPDRMSRLVHAMKEQSNFLVRPCWIRLHNLRQWLPFVRRPYGLMKVHFDVGGDGGVTGARIVSSTVPNHRVDKCMTDGMLAMHFPRPEDGKNFSFEMDYGFGIR
jgi:hypothetical protein